MTKQEAIQEVNKAFEPAFANYIITAFEEGTTESDKCKDAVSRQAMLDNAYAYGNGLEPDGYCVDVEDILALPAVAPTRNKGHWLVNEERDTICCPFCNDKQTIGKDEVKLLKTAFTRFNFCTYCGAAMKG